jgi:hypothetical protein
MRVTMLHVSKALSIIHANGGFELVRCNMENQKKLDEFMKMAE